MVEKKVQVVGYPPDPPQGVEGAKSESGDEAEYPDHPDTESMPTELDHADEGIEELMATFADDETEIDLTHLRLTTTKYLGLERFANTLRKLCLRQNEIKSIRSKDFHSLVHLKDLDLYDNQIEHIAGLENCLELEVLDLSFNNIRHVSRLAHLAKCHTLYLVQNKIAKLRPDDLQMPIATSLRSLELGGNRLHSLEHLDKLVHLEELWVGKNKITSLDGIQHLKNLKILSIQSNRLTKLDNLDELASLEELYVSHNGITSLSGLEHNHQLNTLDFGANQVESLQGVEHLSKMSQFWGNDNRIQDFNHLDQFLGPQLMPDLETIYLEGNPGQKAEGANYRRKISLMLPQIEQLDAT
ncbi:protein phosphatase regulatory subunit Sds22 [Malassezia psittaci]|uniref:Protein phosphatase regulatory subunit Sds22 n=1 Tax=Malassezia psittaci TaxID=1821823 RepID=A0AAF0F591_9BASI|nr:protein phosphatase regulatory subunit Sds22 [Malassezia psittaci]